MENGSALSTQDQEEEGPTWWGADHPWKGRDWGGPACAQRGLHRGWLWLCQVLGRSASPAWCSFAVSRV